MSIAVASCLAIAAAGCVGDDELERGRPPVAFETSSTDGPSTGATDSAPSLSAPPDSTSMASIVSEDPLRPWRHPLDPQPGCSDLVTGADVDALLETEDSTVTEGAEGMCRIEVPGSSLNLNVGIHWPTAKLYVRSDGSLWWPFFGGYVAAECDPRQSVWCLTSTVAGAGLSADELEASGASPVFVDQVLVDARNARSVEAVDVAGFDATLSAFSSVGGMSTAVDVGVPGGWISVRAMTCNYRCPTGAEDSPIVDSRMLVELARVAACRAFPNDAVGCDG